MKNSKWEVGVSASDWHVPFHDNKMVDTLLLFLKRIQPDYFVINGDFIDCFDVSKFDKAPRIGKDFRDEVNEATDLLKHIRKLIPKTRIIMIEGNHEFRLRKYIISNARALYGLKGLSIQEQLELATLGIEWIGSLDGLSQFSHTDWKIGDLYIGHYDKVNKHAGMTAKNLVEELGISMIQGHVHRFGVSSKSLRDGRELIGVEQGCMCSLKPSYMSFPNWQQGFSVFYKKVGKPRFQVYPVRVHDYDFFFGDMEYTYEMAREELYHKLLKT